MHAGKMDHLHKLSGQDVATGEDFMSREDMEQLVKTVCNEDENKS